MMGVTVVGNEGMIKITYFAPRNVQHRKSKRKVNVIITVKGNYCSEVLGSGNKGITRKGSSRYTAIK